MGGVSESLISALGAGLATGEDVSATDRAQASDTLGAGRVGPICREAPCPIGGHGRAAVGATHRGVKVNDHGNHLSVSGGGIIRGGIPVRPTLPREARGSVSPGHPIMSALLLTLSDAVRIAIVRL